MIHSAATNEQGVANLFAGLAFSKHPEDLTFSWRECFDASLRICSGHLRTPSFHQVGCQSMTSKVLTCGHSLDTGDNVSGRALFEHITHGADFERTIEEFLLPVHCQKDDAHRE